MPTIALLGIGMYGHVAPLARLGGVLVRQGHRLLAWAPAAFGGEFADIAELWPHEPVEVRVTNFDLFEFGARLAEETETAVGSVIEQLHEREVELVIHDVHAPWGRVAADFLGIPRIVSVPLFPTILNHDFAAAPLPPKITARVQKASDEIGRRWGIELGDWREVVWSRGEATVIYSTPEIAGLEARPPAVSFVGPLLAPAPPRRPGADRPFVFVSFGTFFGIRRALLRSAIEALSDEHVDVLISTGRAAVTPTDLGPLPPNVAAQEFVAAREVLAHADVFVTHGGVSSIHEALLGGVPMVCLPQGADQFDWSRRVAALRAGKVSEDTPAAIRSAVVELIDDPRYRARAAELGERVASFDGEGRVAELVASLLGGRSSP